MKKIIAILCVSLFSSAAFAEMYMIDEFVEAVQVVNHESYRTGDEVNPVNDEGQKLIDEAVLRVIELYKNRCETNNGEGSFDFGTAYGHLRSDNGMIEVSLRGLCK